jgi:hypothetical protein
LCPRRDAKASRALRCSDFISTVVRIFRLYMHMHVGQRTGKDGLLCSRPAHSFFRAIAAHVRSIAHATTVLTSSADFMYAVISPQEYL